MAADDPSAPSSAYKRMTTGWQMIDAILAGAARVREGTTDYLPKYPDESNDEYSRRLDTTPWRPEFTDALQTLASKPFSKDVSLDRKGPEATAPPKPQVSEALKAFSEDVDQRGNNLTVFAREMFWHGVAKGMEGLLVEWPKAEPNATLADEMRSGARPYWVHVRATDILALYMTMRNGQEVVAHVRIRECTVERSGFEEAIVERVRVLELNDAGTPIWEIWRKGTAEGKDQYYLEEAGSYNNIGVVPLVLYWTGERTGQHEVRPPLLDLAHMQIELYQALSRKEEVLTFAGAPMLCASGLAPPDPGRDSEGNLMPAGAVKVGPRSVLFAPPGVEGVQTGWSYVQPNAANIKEIRDDVQSITDDMRRLGMQPMTQRVGGVTATATGVESAKAHSVVQWWAVSLKDALERAFSLTTKWLGESDEIEVSVHTDFGVDPNATAPLQTLDKARARKDISLRTYWESLKRYEVLPADFDPDAEDQAMAEEAEGLEPEVPIDPVTGVELADGGQQQAA